jgi:chromosome segregation ATPase
MLRKNLVIAFCGLLCLLSWVWPLSETHASEIKQQTITVQIEQWNTLKQQLQEQQVTLLMLQEEITLLKTPSAELMQNLKAAREQLQKAQSELTESNHSLTNASEEIRKVSTLCSELKVQLQQERSKAKLKARQNAFWGFVAGVFIGYVYNVIK